MPTDFEDLDELDPDPYWASFRDGGYTLELTKEDDEEPEEVADRDGPLVGVVTNFRENVGNDNDSTIMTLRTETDPRPIMFFVPSNAENKIQNAGGVSVGDEFGILKTGNEIDVGQPSPMQEYEVRASRTHGVGDGE